MSAITSFEDLLYQIQNYSDEDKQSYPHVAHLAPPADSTIVNVDLNKRTVVDAPDFLSVQHDHNAEIVYFKCARYFENMDLTNCVCIIQYQNAVHENEQGQKVQDSGLFWVPVYGIGEYETDKNDSTLLNPTIWIPWAIGGLATKYPGKIYYTIRFFKMNQNHEYLFNLSISPAFGEIKYGMDIQYTDLENYKIPEDTVTQIYNDINSAITQATTYWVDV